MDYEDKYQYDSSEVQTFGRMSEDFKKAIEEDIDFQTKVTQVVDLLDHNQYYLVLQHSLTVAFLKLLFLLF